MNILKYLSAMLIIVAIAACGNPGDNTRPTVVRSEPTTIGHKRIQRVPGRCIDYKRVRPGKHFKFKGKTFHSKKHCGRKNAFAFCNVKRNNKIKFDVVYSAPFAADEAHAFCSELNGTFSQVQ